MLTPERSGAPLDLRDLPGFKAQVRSSFDATPPTYGAPGDYHWAFAKRLVDCAPLRRGHAVLDVATGTGPAARMAAQRVGPAGTVIGIDLSPGIIAVARHTSAAADSGMIRLLVGDAEQLPLADGAVDGVLCSSAIVWFPDIPRALREWRRVLRRGGWIAFSCFGGAARATTIGLLGDLLLPYGQVLPELNGRTNSPAKCRALVEDAGFERVTMTTAHHQRFPTEPAASFAQAWSGRTRFNIELAPDDVTQLKAQYTAAFARLRAEQAVWNHDYELFVVAHKAA